MIKHRGARGSEFWVVPEREKIVGLADVASGGAAPDYVKGGVGGELSWLKGGLSVRGGDGKKQREE